MADSIPLDSNDTQALRQILEVTRKLAAPFDLDTMLAEVVNAFVRKHGQGTLFGNVVIKRYLEANPSIRDDAVGVHERRFQELLPLWAR